MFKRIHDIEIMPVPFEHAPVSASLCVTRKSLKLLIKPPSACL